MKARSSLPFSSSQIPQPLSLLVRGDNLKHGCCSQCLNVTSPSTLFRLSLGLEHTSLSFLVLYQVVGSDKMDKGVWKVFAEKHF